MLGWVRQTYSISPLISVCSDSETAAERRFSMIQTIGWSTALGLVLVTASYFQLFRVSQLINDQDPDYFDRYWRNENKQPKLLLVALFPISIIISSSMALVAVVLNREDRFSRAMEDPELDLRVMNKMIETKGGGRKEHYDKKRREALKSIRRLKIKRFLNYDLFLIINLSFFMGTGLVLWSDPSSSPVQSWWVWFALLFVLQIQWFFSYVIGAFSLSVFIVKLVSDFSEEFTASIMLNFAVEVFSNPALLTLLTLAAAQAVISAAVEVIS